MANPGRFVGREGYLTWVGRWLEAWESFTVEPLEFEALGDRYVVGRILQRGKGRGSGVEISMETTYLFDFRDGRLARFQVYPDREQALAAARA